MLYDLATGEALHAERGDFGDDQYLNLSVIGIDPAEGAATIAVSGNRNCDAACPPLSLSILSLDNDAGKRHGISPFATVVLDADVTIFSTTITLPMRGTPARYPFDRYTLTLALGHPAAAADETNGADDTGATPVQPFEEQFHSAIQNQVPQMVMIPPSAMYPPEIQQQVGPLIVDGALQLEFRRPSYLMTLSVMLILLVTTSSAITVLTQPLSRLTTSVGSLIIATWGVRAVLNPQGFSLVSGVDLALSGVILLLLVGLLLRVALSLLRKERRSQ
ncbi:MAG: hypothetical protein QM692_16905 [Thermomicrobiales bacterium]